MDFPIPQAAAQNAEWATSLTEERPVSREENGGLDILGQTDSSMLGCGDSIDATAVLSRMESPAGQQEERKSMLTELVVVSFAVIFLGSILWATSRPADEQEHH